MQNWKYGTAENKNCFHWLQKSSKETILSDKLATIGIKGQLSDTHKCVSSGIVYCNVGEVEYVVTQESAVEQLILML